ncbi:biotin synthase-like enzyme, partial [Sphingomonas sp. 1185]
MTTTTALSAETAPPRTDWTRAEIAALFDLPFTELLFRAAEAHRA